MTEKCTECGKAMKLSRGTLPDGITYGCYRCTCGESILTMAQLKEVASVYRKLKRNQSKVSNWGKSLGIRIPKEIAKQYNITADSKVTIIPEKDCFKVVP